MGRKIKFPLEMADGFKVHNGIDELREHFDIDSVLKQYFSGKLEKWLQDRYYEKEAGAIAALNRSDANLSSKLCVILGVKTDNADNVDMEDLKRLNEKEAFLRQRTDDKQILANARITALTQADLADLLDLDESVIYLCGEKFNIPVRLHNKKYIGILGKPKIDIQVNSEIYLKEYNIVFENVELPFQLSSEIDTQSVRENNEEMLTVSKKQLDNKLKVEIQNFIKNIDEEDSSDEPGYGVPPACFLVTFIDSKSELKNNIRNAATDYEDSMRRDFAGAVERVSKKIQNIQRQYEIFFQTANQPYIEPLPNMNEALESFQRGQQSIVSNIGGLGSRLLDMAYFEELEKAHFFDPTEYCLQNQDELVIYMESYWKQAVDVYQSYSVIGKVQEYLKSVKNNLEQLCMK